MQGLTVYCPVYTRLRKANRTLTLRMDLRLFISSKVVIYIPCVYVTTLEIFQGNMKWWIKVILMSRSDHPEEMSSLQTQGPLSNAAVRQKREVSTVILVPRSISYLWNSIWYYLCSSTFSHHGHCFLVKQLKGNPLNSICKIVAPFYYPFFVSLLSRKSKIREVQMNLVVWNRIHGVMRIV